MIIYMYCCFKFKLKKTLCSESNIFVDLRFGSNLRCFKGNMENKTSVSFSHL